MFHKILILFIIFNFTIFCSNGFQCDFQNHEIKCENFLSFSELDFSNVDDTINKISLKPNEQILLDSSLDLQTLNFTKDYIVNLENIKGFQIFSNPFANRQLTKGNLYLTNSIFDFYKDNDKIDLKTCDYINRNEIFVSLFDLFDLVSLNADISYPTEICPAEFKHVKMGIFKLFNLSKTNRLNFMKIPINDSISDLDCRIDDLEIYNSEIDLDTSLIYPEIFKFVKLFFIQSSNVTSIEENLFKNFINLEFFLLSIKNFKELMNMGNVWMKNLNYGNKVNISDQNEVYRNIDKQMLFKMEDLKLEYDYPDSDFCLFQNFPHEKLVFPIIETKENLKCSCTLMYLLKNKNLFAKDPQILVTNSVKDCFFRQDFDQLVKNCEFEKKLEKCKNSTTDYKSLAIVFIVISLILIICLAVMIILILRYRKESFRNDNEIIMSFKPQQN